MPLHHARLGLLLLALLAGLAPHAAVAEPVKPVRMGCGIMTFDTVPGWGLDETGKSVLGSTHGGVAIDKEGTIWTTSSLGIFGFSPEGKVVRRFLGKEYSNIHDVKIHADADGEFSTGLATPRARGSRCIPRPERSC